MVRGKGIDSVTIDPSDPQVGGCCGKAEENLYVGLQIIQRNFMNKRL